jgi:hypothetical protein
LAFDSKGEPPSMRTAALSTSTAALSTSTAALSTSTAALSTSTAALSTSTTCAVINRNDWRIDARSLLSRAGYYTCSQLMDKAGGGSESRLKKVDRRAIDRKADCNDLGQRRLRQMSLGVG